MVSSVRFDSELRCVTKQGCLGDYLEQEMQIKFYRFANDFELRHFYVGVATVIVIAEV
jgi:hypothetical protein